MFQKYCVYGENTIFGSTPYHKHRAIPSLDCLPGMISFFLGIITLMLFGRLALFVAFCWFIWHLIRKFDWSPMEVSTGIHRMRTIWLLVRKVYIQHLYRISHQADFHFSKQNGLSSLLLIVNGGFFCVMIGYLCSSAEEMSPASLLVLSSSSTQNNSIEARLFKGGPFIF